MQNGFTFAKYVVQDAPRSLPIWHLKYCCLVTRFKHVTFLRPTQIHFRVSSNILTSGLELCNGDMAVPSLGQNQGHHIIICWAPSPLDPPSSQPEALPTWHGYIQDLLALSLILGIFQGSMNMLMDPGTFTRICQQLIASWIHPCLLGRPIGDLCRQDGENDFP